MSFLNPVNEPVLRFKSTDADAPQINYAARTAGDVKAVLKACLVTGYGSTASAGWSIVNEVDHVAEFVSPSAAMSDYKFGIEDNSATITSWYYGHKGARVDPINNQPIKGIRVVNRSHPSNGWQLIVSSRGFYFIELLQHSAIPFLVSRMTYIGAVKAAVVSDDSANIAFYNIGQDATCSEPFNFYKKGFNYFKVYNEVDLQVIGATPYALGTSETIFDRSYVDIITPLYLVSSDKSTIVGQLAGIFSKVINEKNNLNGGVDEQLDNRAVLKVTLGYFDPTERYAYSFARVMLISLDNWEY